MSIFLLILGCANEPPTGWLPTEQTGGPTVLYDVNTKPFPEIPIPNNQATRLDPTSPTGRRLNISEDAPTEYERDTRRKFNLLDGFGTYASILVSFDAPLDVADIYARHTENQDFRDDSIFVLNVDPNCSRYGEEVALDIQSGRSPFSLYRFGQRYPDADAPNGEYYSESGNKYFRFDSRFDYHNLLFEERNEDLNGNGVLDDGEDVDRDGILDYANFIDPNACDALEGKEFDRCVADNLMNFYDRQANRLFLKPMWPLEQQCTYAVVLTKRLKGENGKAIQSPFPYVNPQSQTQDVRGASEFLSRYNLTEDDVAFAWAFTTGTMTKDLEELRKGLYGVGNFARFAEEFPTASFDPLSRAELAESAGVESVAGKEGEHYFDGACSAAALTWLKGPNAIGAWPGYICALEGDYSAMGAIFGGGFQAPNLLVDKDGIATEKYPADNEEVWDFDYTTGEAVYGTSDVSFWCSLPKELDTSCSEGNPEGKPFCKPYPVILYAHGYGGSHNEIIDHMGRHNAMGYAICALDSYGHGLKRWGEDPIAGATLNYAGVEFQRDGVPELKGLMVSGRDRDVNNDGFSDSGVDMWTADIFHTRDMLRQSALEYMQFVRILRSMDGSNLDANGSVLGDIDGDGMVDLGGSENTIGMWGISLGGIISGIMAGAEPSLDAVSPNAGGAGLVDIAIRARQQGVPQAVVMPMMGQIVVGCIPSDSHQNPIETGLAGGGDCLGVGALEGQKGGDFRLGFVVNDEAREEMRAFAMVEGIEVGDRVVVRNLVSGETEEGYISERGWFRVGVASDAIEPIERRPMLGMDDDDVDPEVPDDNRDFADALEIEIFRGETSIALVNTFQEEFSFQGTTYVVGSPLVALQQGLGHARNTPDFARFLAIAQSAISPADPAIWGAHTFLEPLDYSYDPYARGTHVLMMPTAGDVNVPVNTGVAMGRVSGLLGSWLRDPDQYGPEYGWREMFVPDERYGVSVDQFLIDTYAIEGDALLQRFGDNPVNPNVLYDVDNVSDGDSQFSCGDSDWSAMIGENECPPEVQGQEVFFDVPNPEAGKELRLNWEREDGTFDAFRLPLLRPAGQHGIYNAQPFRVFDNDAYMVNFTIQYLGTRGGAVDHYSGCDCSASQITQMYRNGEEIYPSFDGEACTEGDLKLCSEECTGWGIQTPDVVECISE